MKRIISEEELVGKTITRTAYTDNKFFLFFSDNSYCIFRGHGWDENNVELSEEPFDTVPNGYNLHDLRVTGFISEDTYLQLIEERKKQDLEQKRLDDLEKLADLKRKYPEA